MRYRIIDKSRTVVFPNGQVEGKDFEFESDACGFGADKLAALVGAGKIVVVKARGRSETTKEDKGRGARRK